MAEESGVRVAEDYREDRSVAWSATSRVLFPINYHSSRLPGTHSERRGLSSQEPMNPRICQCCGEPMPEKGNVLSRNPNICASCSSLADGMDDAAVPAGTGAPSAKAATNSGAEPVAQEQLQGKTADPAVHHLLT